VNSKFKLMIIATLPTKLQCFFIVPNTILVPVKVNRLAERSILLSDSVVKI
jgi:hypothetical protein